MAGRGKEPRGDCGAADARVWRVLGDLDSTLHARTFDWPGIHPDPIAAPDAWRELGRPHLLVLVTCRGPLAAPVLERAWVRADGRLGHDRITLPTSPLPAAGATGAFADLTPWTEALIPQEILLGLIQGGLADDLVVIASEDLLGLPWPLLPIFDARHHGHGEGERLTAYAAVSLLPSLSWGVHLVRRTTRASSAEKLGVLAYLDPAANLDGVRALLSAGVHPRRAESLACLGTALALERPGAVIVASHGTFTSDGSVDLRDHLGGAIPPELLCTWQLPALAIITGCRTGTSNGSAPLHLAEAALVAGASHVIAATHRTTDEVLDVLLSAVLRRLPQLRTDGRPVRGLSPAQAVQSALQQANRAFPIPATDPTPWSVVHVGLPSNTEATPTPRDSGRCGSRQ